MNTTEMIIQFFKNYGWQLTVLATSGIVFLGILKATGMFNKVSDKAKKYLYYGLSAILSIIACTAYIFIKDTFEWRAYLILIAAIIGYTSAIYTLYENTGIRELLKKFIFTPIKTVLIKSWKKILTGTIDKKTVIALASDYGVEVANEIINSAVEKEAEKKLIEEQKAAEEAEKKAKKEEAKVEAKVEVKEEIPVQAKNPFHFINNKK